MHTPPHFKEDRIDVLHDLIDQARLVTLVTMGGARLDVFANEPAVNAKPPERDR